MIIYKELELTDIYDKVGFTECLAQLEGVALTNKELELIYFIRQKTKIIRTLVAIEPTLNIVVGTASIIIEPKFIHGGKSVGHIEDVAVHPEHHKQGIGKNLVEKLVNLSKYFNCYKVLLHCDEDVVEFYKKLGFYQTPNGMRKDCE